MEQQEQAPLEPSRDDVIRACAAVLPTVVIARLLNVQPLTINRRKVKLGLSTDLREGKLLTSAFLKALPDLNLLPLSETQRREVRLLRLAWLNERRGDHETLERASEIVLGCSNMLPTTAIAAVLTMTNDRVLAFQRELEVTVTRSERRTLEHRFAAAGSCPKVPMLTAAEDARLAAAWKKAHAAKLEYDQVRVGKSEDHRARLLRKLEGVKADLLAREPTTPISRCSGTCGYEWPRTKRFFTPNFRSSDGLAERCKYCQYNRQVASKRRGSQGKRRVRGRVLSATERVHVLEVFRAYGRIIPGRLLKHLFRIGEGTLARLRRESGTRISTKEARRIHWRYFFSNRAEQFELLHDAEIARLYLLSSAFKRLVQQRFEPDEEHRRYLLAQRARLRGEEYDKRIALIPEISCTGCNEQYPATDEFFVKDGERIRKLCKFCANSEQRQRTLERLRLRFMG